TLESNSSNLHAFGEKFFFAPEDYLLPGTFDPDPRLITLVEKLAKQITTKEKDKKIKEKKLADISKLFNLGRIESLESVLAGCENLSEEDKQTIRAAVQKAGKKFEWEGKNLQTSLLGYLARIHRDEEWANILELIRDRVERDDVINALRNIDEWTDIPTILLGNAMQTGLFTGSEQDKRDLAVLFDILSRWISEMRPSNFAATEAMGLDQFEFHLYVSRQLGKFRYYDALQRIRNSGHYLSPTDIFEYLSGKTDRTPEENIFIDKYPHYQRLVDVKLRHIYHEVALWGGGDEFTVDNNGILIKMPACDNLRKKMLSVPGIAGKVPRQWADEFIQWREDKAAEIVNQLRGDNSFIGDLERLTRLANFIITTDKAHVIMARHKSPQDIQYPPPVKNQYIANNLYMYYPIATNYDAWVRTYPGQSVWRVAWASFQGRNPHIGTVNPMMMVWGAGARSFWPNKWAFAVTTIYAIAQEVWTGDVQRARRGGLTFFGKGCLRPEAAVVLLSPPGEDSGSFLVLQS
ncbi:MAG: hypothetical protein NT066_07080, partial [Candidatus Omnitrophica bacterium]|nr:hypothetical protein [Candidatus Omnitrophota bacterium]